MAVPEMLVIDNCCHVQGNVMQALPHICVLLDVYHFMMRFEGSLVFYQKKTHLFQRYLGAVLNGAKNPYRSQVAQDICDAILKT